MVPYNTRKVTREILEREEILYLTTPRSPRKLVSREAVLNEFLFPEKKSYSLGQMVHHFFSSPYRGGGVAIFKEFDGVPHVLLGKRLFNPGAGKWSFPGGKAEGKETLGKAAFRELKEELGINLLKKNSSVVGRFEVDLFFYKWRTVLVDTSDSTIGKKFSRKGNLSRTPRNSFISEFTKVSWVPVTDLGRFNLHPGVRPAVNKYLTIKRG